MFEDLEYGYVGGGSLYRLGSREFINSFFIAIEKYVLNVKLYRELDWSQITEDLYRKTICADKLDLTIGTMARLLHLMCETPLSSVDWDALGIPEPETAPFALSHPTPSLRDLYINFEFGLAQCALGVKFRNLENEGGRPVRIGALSPQIYIYEDYRPAEHYDALGPNDVPYWLRDDNDYSYVTEIRQREMAEAAARDMSK
jgi:hypothetical protein